jgi:hypothetical protein
MINKCIHENSNQNRHTPATAITTFFCFPSRVSMVNAKSVFDSVEWKFSLILIASKWIKNKLLELQRDPCKHRVSSGAYFAKRNFGKKGKSSWNIYFSFSRFFIFSFVLLFLRGRTEKEIFHALFTNNKKWSLVDFGKVFGAFVCLSTLFVH